MAYKYTILNPAEYTDEQITEGVAFGNKLQAEVLPDDPPTQAADAIAAHKEVPARFRRWAVRVTDDTGDIVASVGWGEDPEHNDNPDIMWGGPNVLAEHRRQGIGTQLFAYFVAKAGVENRTRIVGGTNDRIPDGLAFAKKLGAEVKQANHMNHLPVDECDRSLMQQWVDEGPTRAEDYEIIGWDGPVPEEYLDQWVDIVLVMNTAPRDDLQMNDFTLTREEVREGEKRMAAYGGEQWTLVARRKSDGEWAGFHDMTWIKSEPEYIYVGGTGVRPEHRGHALGKWLKAAMMLKVMDERPGVTHVRTGNADSNDAMLGINKQMGYRPLIASTTWELPVEKAATWLAERGVELPSV